MFHDKAWNLLITWTPSAKIGSCMVDESFFLNRGVSEMVEFAERVDTSVKVGVLFKERLLTLAEERGVEVILTPYQLRYVHKGFLRIVNLHDEKRIPDVNVLKAVANLVRTKGFQSREKELVAKDLEKLIRKEDAKYKLPAVKIPIVKEEPVDLEFAQQQETLKAHLKKYGDPRDEVSVEEGEIRERRGAIVEPTLAFIKSPDGKENEVLIYTDKYGDETVIEITTHTFLNHTYEVLCDVRELLEDWTGLEEQDRKYLLGSLNNFCNKRKQMDIDELRKCTTGRVIGYPKQLVIKKKGQKGYPDKVTTLSFKDIPKKLTTPKQVHRWLRLFQDRQMKNHVEEEGRDLLLRRLREVSDLDHMKKEKAAKTKAKEEAEKRKYL